MTHAEIQSGANNLEMKQIPEQQIFNKKFVEIKNVLWNQIKQILNLKNDEISYLDVELAKEFWIEKKLENFIKSLKAKNDENYKEALVA